MPDDLKGWTCAATVSVTRASPRRCACTAKILVTTKRGRRCGLCGIHKRELAYRGKVHVYGPVKDPKDWRKIPAWQDDVEDAAALAACEQRLQEGQRALDENRTLAGYYAVAEAAGLPLDEVLARCPRKDKS